MVKKRTRHIKRDNARRRGLRLPPPAPPPFEPRVSPKLSQILSGIGVPEKMPFVPDPFQVESVATLAQMDVVVSAPTGSGKTWIAVEAIRQALAQGQRAWYASPLKALSNAKYHEFGEIFGTDQVGILTGDRKENSHAPLIVGTTEILRNQLYDAMYRGRDLGAGLVVLDEAHYLGDLDRGVVWEEVIIYLAPRVRLLLLSATVENADQIARWLEFVRDRPCATVKSDLRPVPLHPIFMLPEGELTPLTTRRGLFGKVAHFLEQESQRRPGGPVPHLPPFAHILRLLAYAELLPAIFFLKSRADCDAALGAATGARVEVPPAQRQALRKEVDGYLAEHPFLLNHPQLEALRNLHVASHHAGHLPHWKLLVERLMQKGLLKAIFSTSTVAAGVNFPARTVAITQSDRFNGRDFVDLTATDLLQMTGRAGRRGMDKLGFALIVPGPYQNVPLVAGLLRSSPEPIKSQLSINFSMVLNLLLSHRPPEIKQLLGLSLATFQRLEERKGSRRGHGPAQALHQLATRLEGSGCPGPEEAVVRRRRRQQLEALGGRLRAQMAGMGHRQGFWPVLTRGRVFLDLLGQPMAVLRREDGDDPGVLGVVLIPDRRLQRGKPRLDFIPADEVIEVFEDVLSLPHAGGSRGLAQAVLDQLPIKERPLDPERLEELGRLEREELSERLGEVEDELGGLQCPDCALSDQCLDPKSDLAALIERAQESLSLVREESHAFWYDFVRHLEFLRAEGFVEPGGKLTDDGLWASKLRLDQPVLIAEAIRQEALPQEDPVLLAGLLALFVDEREREGAATPFVAPRLAKGIGRLQTILHPLLGRLRGWGFNTPPMPVQAAAAIYAWAMRGEFVDVVSIYGGAEGDLAQLIYRTADNLRQLASLRETHPHLAATCREAEDLLLRPPVVVLT